MASNSVSFLLCLYGVDRKFQHGKSVILLATPLLDPKNCPSKGPLFGDIPSSKRAIWLNRSGKRGKALLLPCTLQRMGGPVIAARYSFGDYPIAFATETLLDDSLVIEDRSCAITEVRLGMVDEWDGSGHQS